MNIMNEFLIVMNKIPDNLKKLKKEPDNDECYKELKNDLRSLESLIENHQIPNDVYSIVLEFYTKAYRYVSYLRPYGDKISKIK